MNQRFGDGDNHLSVHSLASADVLATESEETYTICFNVTAVVSSNSTAVTYFC